MKNFQHLVLERRGPVLWIYLNRPEVKNALTLEMADEFLKAIRLGMKEKDVAVLVLSGKGETFSAGGDIQLMGKSKNLRAFFLQISKMIHQAVQEMRNGNKPVLAAVPGFAGGIALGVVLAADLRIASTKARFSAATIRLGLVANGSATYFLPRLVGLARASEILLTGHPVSAEEALPMGLINRVVSPEELEPITQSLAENLASGPRKALARVKKILNASLDSTLSVQMERERQSIAWSSTLPDFQEGVRAFLEKRKPQFNR